MIVQTEPAAAGQLIVAPLIVWFISDPAVSLLYVNVPARAAGDKIVRVAAAVTGIYAWRHIGGGGSDPGEGGVRPGARQPSGSSDAHGFMDKMEERWRRRRDESGF